MLFDHVAEEQQEKNFTLWVHAFLRKSPEHLAMRLAATHRSGKPIAACRWKNGSFNLCYRVKYEDGYNAIVRFAALGRTIHRHEKVDNEVAVMDYLRRYTSIKVPEVLGTGTCWAGPYIVMSFIEGEPLSSLLKDPCHDGRPVLNPQIRNGVLKRAYREMAQVLLELWKPEFPRIGGLEKDGKGFTVSRRPLTYNMNELATSANLPPRAFPAQTFDSANDYFVCLANQHLAQLQHQRNDAITDEDDGRKKYVARCLFRKIVHHLSMDEHCLGPFRLYCDDFRPSNVLVDLHTLQIAGVVDWEFTYAAPTTFSCVAPWWLLLQSPEDWEADLDEFVERYMPRLRLFLDALRECEDDGAPVPDSARLSQRMERSIDTGLFWVCLAARSSSMFDEIYWTFLDERHHGPFTSIEDRINLLSEEERIGLDEFVRTKAEHIVEGPLESHYSVDDLVDL
jgi:aminoglycoside phosphotransferase (APT) family kinase protein